MKFSAFLFLFFVAFTGCKKGFDDFSIETPVNDTVWAFNNNAQLSVNELHQALALLPLSDSFNLTTGGAINFSNNTRVVIPPAAFASGNTGVDEKGTIDLTLLKQKGDFIRFCRPTTSNGYLLQSGGILNISIKKNGQALQLLPNSKIQVFFDDNQPTIAIRSFSGVLPTTGSFDNFNWLPIADSSLQVLLTSTGYQVLTARQQWINCGFYADTAATASRTVISMPRDFTNANTTAFIVYKNVRSVMQLNADVANRIWIAQKVPVGKEVLYVTITQKRGEYWLGMQDATTAPFQNIHIVPQKITLQGIKGFLDGL